MRSARENEVRSACKKKKRKNEALFEDPVKSDKPENLYKAVPIPDDHKIIYSHKDANKFYKMFRKSPSFPGYFY